MTRLTRLPIILAFGFISFVAFATTASADWDDWDDHEKCCDCPGILEPVCGVDGNTWINACEAECARVEVESVGPCAPPECGGPQGLACEEGEFCETPPGCDPMAGGACEMIPDVCTDEFDPVCGCDGETYPNDCERRKAGVPLDFAGACEDAPQPCESNDDCSDGEYCERPAEVCDSKPGTCIMRPLTCTLDFDPICGCDGESYSNPCAAAHEGVNVAYEGECGPVACHDNDDCAENEYCQKRTGKCDSVGVCEPRPDVCPLVIDRVCGCDGITYNNACEAASAGVSLESDEECRSEDGVPICHIPPGNSAARHTIHVGGPAVPAHLRHGDYLGPCQSWTSGIGATRPWP